MDFVCLGSCRSDEIRMEKWWQMFRLGERGAYMRDRILLVCVIFAGLEQIRYFRFLIVFGGGGGQGGKIAIRDQ